MKRGFAAIPLRDADVAVTGERVPFYQDWLARKDDDAFWAPVEFERHLDSLTVPVTMVTGWYDMFLPAQLADYRALRAAGRDVRLTIGPWKHTDPGVAGESLRDSLDWFETHLLDRDRSPRRSRVRLFVGGARRWLDVDEWPPPARQRPLAPAPGRPAPHAAPQGVGSGSVPLRPVGSDAVGRRQLARDGPEGRATTAPSSGAATCSSTPRQRWCATSR